MSAAASPAPSDARRAYGVGLILLTLGATALLSDRADLEDFVLWALAALLVVAGGLLAADHRNARGTFLAGASAGFLAAAYAIVVWGLIFLFERSAALSGEMLTVLGVALVAVVYLVAGLILLRPRRRA